MTSDLPQLAGRAFVGILLTRGSTDVAEDAVVLVSCWYHLNPITHLDVIADACH
jgi:hypothetical protein